MQWRQCLSELRHLVLQMHHLFPSTTTTAPRSPRPLGFVPHHLAAAAPSLLNLLVVRQHAPASRSPVVPPLLSRLGIRTYLRHPLEAWETRDRVRGSTGGTCWGARWVDEGHRSMGSRPAGFRASILNGSQALQGPGLDAMPGQNVGDGTRGGFAGSSNSTPIPSFSSFSLFPSDTSFESRTTRLCRHLTETASPGQPPLWQHPGPTRTAARFGTVTLMNTTSAADHMS